MPERYLPDKSRQLYRVHYFHQRPINDHGFTDEDARRRQRPILTFYGFFDANGDHARPDNGLRCS